MSVKLISITPESEKIIAYCARVSSPNQDNPDYNKLLKYCFKHGHMSIFEMANMCVEIETSRAISPQILRHRSFSFQEFSQRYAPVEKQYVEYEARSQDLKNRQNSNDDLTEEVKSKFKELQEMMWNISYGFYQEALKAGIAKECARVLLPLSSPTKLYMNGSIRSWLTYCIVRCEKATQLEHRLIANECWKILRQQVPIVAKAVEEEYNYLAEII